MIEVKGLDLVYNDHGKEIFACRDIDLTLKDGEYLGILGPSGSGKSSLLYLMSGLKQPTRGEVHWDDQVVSKLSESMNAAYRHREFGFVFQIPYLVGYLSSLENVVIGTPDRGAWEEAAELLDRLGLANKKDRLPHELSGGERQRVCVARALIGNPRVVFADEPTASLDQTSGREVMRLLREIRGDGSLVVVTHDPSMLDGADTIVEIDDGQIVARHDDPVVALSV